MITKPARAILSRRRKVARSAGLGLVFGIGFALLLGLLILVGGLVTGSLIMLGFGVLHSVWPQVPAIGLWPVAFTLGVILNVLLPSSS